jgi:NADH:ubiquinone oxidoreductase subunit F (NADH-binding)
MTITESAPSLTTATADRLFLAQDASYRAHTESYGGLPGTGGVLRAIAESGLTGRGGSGFPTWRKIESVKDARRPVVVANGSEGEPASRKDATLLAHAPHLVLDGLVIVAEAIGGSMHLATTKDRISGIERAIAERGAKVRVTEVVERFISGEESAVVAAINGRLPLPADRLTRVWESGVEGRPTVVLNVETLAHIALIARHGSQWFRTFGEAEDPGTFLATVSPTMNNSDWRPSVYELARGAHLGTFLDQVGFSSPSAVLVGGYHGTWLTGDALAQARLSRPGLAPYGSAPGAGVLIPIEHQCGLRETSRILSYLAGEVAGQCGPCVNGLPALASHFRDLVAGRANSVTMQELYRISGLVRGRGACSHPDGTARLAASALNAFADDVEQHLRGGCRVF